MASRLGSEPHVRLPEIAERPQTVCPGHVSVSQRGGVARRHPEGYTATDIVCRYRRMKGEHVMHPMGWDAFGLPAEQYAKQTGTHPRATTEKNIATFRRQLKMLGFSYDWDRELATTDVDYFRWTQWIFLLLFDTWFDRSRQRAGRSPNCRSRPRSPPQGGDAVDRYRDEHRLAYQLEAPVNWCPALGTVLANEEVTGGMSERGGHPVVRIPLRQWMLRITAYADRLEKDLDALDWPESIKLLQRNWIGRSTGAEVDFYIGGQGSGVRGQGPLATADLVRGVEKGAGPLGFPPQTGRRGAEGLHHPARHAVRRHLHGRRPGAPVCRASDHARAGRGRPGVLPAVGPQERPRSDRSGQGEDRRLHRLLRHQSGQR